MTTPYSLLLLVFVRGRSPAGIPRIGHDREVAASYGLSCPYPARPSMTEAVTDFASWVGEAISPYILDAAYVSIILLLALFWMLFAIIILKN
jgi:hypothetical protein